MSRRRTLSREEHALWRAITASVKPLRATPKLATPEETQPGGLPPPVAAVRPASRPHLAATKAPAKSPPPPPPLSALDRRTRQRVARGAVAIDARIDLHGMTQERAHAALLRFVRAAHVGDARLVLVITGKGSRGGDGVLRRLTPHWLSLPELRAAVLGFEPAHASHGGEGALYVRIRRRRE